MITPPHNVPAERGMISAALQYNRVLDEADLSPDMFYVEAHRVIWQHIQQCRNLGQVADLVTVGGRLMDQGHPVATPVYLADLADGLALSSRAYDYAAMIKDCFIRREAIRGAAEITIAAQQQSAEEVVALAQSHFLSMDSAEDRAYSLDVVVAETLTVMDNRKTGELPGLSTGLADLDARTNGLHATDLIILAARPAMGKSALAGNISVNVAAAGVPVFFLSLEMSRGQLAERMLADKSGVGLTKIKTGGFIGEEKPRIHAAGRYLAGLPLVIDDRPSPSIAQVRSRCRRAKAQHNIGLIVVDYLQYIRAPGTRGREQEVAEISRQLKAMAKEIGVPVLSLAQLNRGSEHRESAKPKLADLRDSGQIEQDADQVWFIYREDYYKPDTERKGIADIIIAKNRNGATGNVELLWQGTITSFRNLQRHF